MQVTIRHSPSFAVARCTLAAGEKARVESGAMMATSTGVTVEAKMEGGFMKSLKRATLGGESLFISTYTAPDGGGFVDVVPQLPGDVVTFEVEPSRALFIQRGPWLAASGSVELDTKWGGLKNLAGGEGGFLVRAAGQGTVVASCYGALESWDLKEGERMTLDTGHMVAYQEGVTFQIRKVAGGLVQSLKSGEALVFDFTGPGRVLTQTRSPRMLIDWLTTVLPFTPRVTPAPTLFASETSGSGVAIDASPLAWVLLLGFIAALLLVDLLVLHREAHTPRFRRSAVESAGWIAVGLAFGVVMLWWQGGAAAGEYYAGYLVEKSLSVDNVFVWALIFSAFAIPLRYQHRVLFWGIFGALVLRAIFIFLGVAIIERFEWTLFIFGAFLVFTAIRLVTRGEEQHADPRNSRMFRLVARVVPSTDEYHGQHLFARVDHRLLATPLFLVLILVEATDVVFAVDSIPAVLAVTRDQFIAFSSNAFAILGLRALYFLLAGAHARFSYLEEGLAVILAFVGVKMIISPWYHIATWLSLLVIFLVLLMAVLASLRKPADALPFDDEVPPPVEDVPPPVQER